ncbi:hypothetical protein TNCV_4583011 [Trichonephila clavipes]|nr:hypothetical protein TNCV_4583011 [Trichonephila clavipes]
MFSGGTALYDNTHPCSVVATQVLMDQFELEILDHPPHSPNFAPNDCHLFPSGKSFWVVNVLKMMKSWIMPYLPDPNVLRSEEYNTEILMREN